MRISNRLGDISLIYQVSDIGISSLPLVVVGYFNTFSDKIEMGMLSKCVEGSRISGILAFSNEKVLEWSMTAGVVMTITLYLYMRSSYIFIHQSQERILCKNNIITLIKQVLLFAIFIVPVSYVATLIIRWKLF